MKIGFCGTMSVGKSTLVKALKKLPEFKEYKFETEKSKEIRDKGVKLNTDSTLLGQMIFANYRAEELLEDNIITDRTIIDVMAFTKLAKSISHLEKEQFCDLYKNLIEEYDYIFYISPEGIEIEDNGIRTIDPIYREDIDWVIKRLIDRYSYMFKNYHEISGSTEERIKKIKEIIF